MSFGVYKVSRAFLKIFAFTLLLASQSYGSEEKLNVPKCLNDLFEGKIGAVKHYTLPVSFMGRLAIGDLNSDGYADFVVSNRDKLAAYDICGKKLWQVKARTNWDFENHVFWNWTSYGYIGDVDGDGKGEFLHLASVW